MAQMPFIRVLLTHKLTQICTCSQGHQRHREILRRLPKCRKELRTISTGSTNRSEDERNVAEPSPLNSSLTSRQVLVSRRRRPLSPLERISRLLPQDALSPEVTQLRQNQEEPEEDETARRHQSFCGASGDPETQTQDETTPTEGSQSHVDADCPQEEVRMTSPVLPGESSIVFGELLLAEFRKKERVSFRKIFRLQTGKRLQSTWGFINHDRIAGQPAGHFLRTSLNLPILIRRPSLEDYVLYMKRAPAISYPKDASAMLMMMDVTEGDRVLESGSGSGAMSLFLSRAVGARGKVVSVEIREDHHKRAVLNYNQWRAAWQLRRGEEWPDNVQFHVADLSAASSLLAGQGFHAVSLDIINPQLVLSTTIPHLHSGAVCAVYLANITQVIDLLDGIRCLALPLLCERIIEVPSRDWLVAPALQKDGKYCTRKAPVSCKDQGEENETSDEAKEEMKAQQLPAFGSIPYIARPHPEQMSHTAFLVKLRKVVQ